MVNVAQDTLRRWIHLHITKKKMNEKEWQTKCARYTAVHLYPVCVRKDLVDPAWWELLAKHNLNYDEGELIDKIPFTYEKIRCYLVAAEFVHKASVNNLLERQSARELNGFVFQLDLNRAPRLAQAVWSFDQHGDFGAVLRMCKPLLAINPFKRFSFGGDIQHDVACMVYVAKIFFQMIKHVLASELSEKPLQLWLCDEANIKKANDLRLEGNELFRKENFSAAAALYTKGLEINRFCHLLHGNRALCYLKMKHFSKAFDGGLYATFCDQFYAKGYQHAANAAYGLGLFSMAIGICAGALEGIPDNKDLETLMEKVSRSMQGRQWSPPEPNRTEAAACEDPSRTERDPAKTVEFKPQQIETENDAALEVKLAEAQSQFSYLEGVVADLKTEIARIRKEEAEEVAEVKQKTIQAEVEVLGLRKEAELRRLQKKLERAETAAKAAAEDFASQGTSAARETHVTCLTQVADIKRAMGKVERHSKDQIQMLKRGTPLKLIPPFDAPDASK
ncbi:hypothetical protein CAPTEDRAFT_193111 [Capitella teleta]|uniref:TTC3/DZIP3-like helical domain-containing protein n=1 Tax=Capitella teleta TaxID=283909 RepID=R7UUY2_CAPTE|nr:hypothetical protein CAPTEDRAFT_193111 [Capitella teleta]|eukprot:ELU07742.1 hypothetical protein CAPTEDRAFT_193111 [Capitella teleta]